jgi:hypothetical protein
METSSSTDQDAVIEVVHNVLSVEEKDLSQPNVSGRATIDESKLSIDCNAHEISEMVNLQYKRVNMADATTEKDFVLNISPDGNSLNVQYRGAVHSCYKDLDLLSAANTIIYGVCKNTFNVFEYRTRFLDEQIGLTKSSFVSTSCMEYALMQESCSKITTKLLLTSYFIMIIQIIVLIALIYENCDYPNVEFSYGVWLARLFISLYLALTLPKSLGQLTDTLFIEHIDTDDSIISTIMNVLKVPFLLPFYMFISIANLLIDREKTLVFKLNILFYIFYETVIFNGLIIATILVVRAQSDIINSLFNFGGILVVSELDNVLASHVKIEGVILILHSRNDPVSSTEEAKKNDVGVTKKQENMDDSFFIATLIVLLIFLLIN